MELEQAHPLVGVVMTAGVVAWKLYRFPVLQHRVPARYRWENLTELQRWAVTLAGSTVGGVLTALTTGMSGLDLVRVVLKTVLDAVTAPK